MKSLSGVLFIALAASVVLAATWTIAHEGEKHEKAEEQGQIKVQGEILDLACWVPHGAQGDDHAACAKRCVKGGQPMGLLTSDGTVYLLYANHKNPSAFEQAKDLAGQKVEIDGKQASKGGIKGIEILGVKSI